MRKIAFGFLFVLIFSIPMEEIVAIGAVGSICRLIGYAVIFSTILAVIETMSLRPLDKTHYVMAAFLLWAGASLAWTHNFDMSMTRALTYIRVMGLAWIIWEIASDIHRQAYLMLAYVLGCFTGIILQFLQYSASSHYGYRFSGGGLNVNDFALMQVLAIPLAIYLARTQYIKMRWIRWLCGAFCPLAALAVLLSGSRTGLLVMLGMGMIFLVANAQYRWKALVIVAITAGIAGPTFFWFAPEKTVERVLGTREALGGNWTLRKQIVEEGLRVSAKNRIVGTGTGTFPSVVGGIHRKNLRSIKHDYASHNAYLSVLVELGVVGLGLFAAILVVCFVEIWQLRQPERLIWLLVFTGWAVGVYAKSWDYRKPTWFLLGMIAAQHSVARRGSNNILPQSTARTTR